MNGNKIGGMTQSLQKSRSNLGIISSGQGDGSGIKTNQIKLVNGLGLKQYQHKQDQINQIFNQQSRHENGTILVSIGDQSNEIEEQRLLVDRALDKLRGEIRQKELERYEPMLQTQMRLIEDHM